MRVQLVAMPWSLRSRPSAAHAALAAYVLAHRPECDVSIRSEFLDVSELIGADFYDELARVAYSVGDLVYASLLYPEKREETRAYFAQWVARERWPSVHSASDDEEAWLQAGGAQFDALSEHLLRHAQNLASYLAEHSDLVGLTTSFGQLFANVLVAQLLKERKPSVRIVLGGSTISAEVGPSVFAEYNCIDYIVQGEGEKNLVEILDAEREGRAPRSKAILCRASTQGPAGLEELGRLDALPFPDYREYAERAEALGIEWAMSLEGSRGCWWDRARTTQNPKNTCYFCNLNVQWGGYREKTVQHVVEEVDALTDTYSNPHLYFVDNIIRHKGVMELAQGIQGLNKDLSIFYEARANLRPLEFLALWEAGLSSMQFGIEAFSTSLLKRIGKGTRTIQNLQAMRLCNEYGVAHSGNLITDFPGSTEAEVETSVQTLKRYALSYEPLSLTRFRLGRGSTVHALASEFQLKNVRNADLYREALPPHVLERLVLLDLDFDFEGEPVDWAPVHEAASEWKKLYAQRGARMLIYRDGGTFLTVEDNRFESYSTGTFKGLEREVFLFCTEIRNLAQLKERFPHVEEAALVQALATFIDYHLMFEEDGHYLALPVAPTPNIAARRLRKNNPAVSGQPFLRRAMPGKTGPESPAPSLLT